MTAWWQTLSRAQKRFGLMCALLALVLLALYGGGHARYGLFDVDEAIFTQATVEMRHSGAISMPTYNGEPRYHKPPLFYWVQGAFMGLLGEGSLYAARLPSVMGALGALLLLGWGVARLSGSRRWGLMATLALGLNLSFVVVGRAATADGLLNLTSVALALWVVHVMYPGNNVLERGDAKAVSAALVTARLKAVTARAAAQRHLWLVTGALAAVGFLAKGPVAWIPAALMVLAVLALRRDRGVIWRRLAPVKAGALCLLLLLPWVGLLVVQFGFGFFYDFFIQHNLHRYAGGLSNTQSDSVFYYLVVLLVGFFPWVFMLPKAVAMTLKGGTRRLRQGLRGDDPARALPYLALIWAVGYVVFFSFSQTKLAHYIVPAYPALAILVGMVLAQVPAVRLGTLVTLLGGMLGLLMGLLMLALNPLLLGLRSDTLSGVLGWLQAVLGFDWPPRDPMASAVLALPVELNVAPFLVGGLLLLVVVPAWGLVARGAARGARAGALLLATSWAACLLLIAGGVVPTIWRYTQAPLAEVAQAMRAAPATTAMIHLGVHKPSVRYLSGRPFTKLENPLQLPGTLTATETWVLTEEDKVAPIVTELGLRGRAQVLGQRCHGGYCLLLVAQPGLPGEAEQAAPETE